jgi:hypothetical protein
MIVRKFFVANLSWEFERTFIKPFIYITASWSFTGRGNIDCRDNKSR